MSGNKKLQLSDTANPLNVAPGEANMKNEIGEIRQQLSKISDKDDWMKDSTHLLSIFPEEVWLLVTENIADCDDAEGFSNSSLYLRHLTKANRVNFLFPKMFCILGKSMYDTKIAAEKLSENEFRGIRLVSKFWCHGVDNYFTKSHKPDKDITFDEANSESMDKFLQHFEKTHDLGSAIRSPFFGGGMQLKYSMDRNEYFGKLNVILLKYGHHVRNCTILARDFFPTRIHYYRKLNELLALMPNLKKLEIEYVLRESRMLGDPADIGGFVVVFTREVPISTEQGAQLLNEIELNPLLKLDYLEELSVKNMPPAILKQLIVSNPHLSKFSLIQERDHDFLDRSIYEIELANLKELSLEISLRNDFRNLKRSLVKWPLNTLTLTFSNQAPFIKWSRIFKILANHWAGTLTKLVMDFPRSDGHKDETMIIQECSTLRLNLPRLETLVMTLNDFTSLDFILPLSKSLKKLDLVINCNFNHWREKPLGRAVEKHEIINFIGCIGEEKNVKRLLNSNIWTLCSRLEQFKISVKYDDSTSHAALPNARWLIGREKNIISYGGLLTRQQWEWKQKEISETSKPEVNT